MIPIKYVKGDATRPYGEGNKIIAHCCNDCTSGVWGAGFVLALSRRWKQPEVQYRKWSKGHIKNLPFELGQVQFVPVEKDITVANMIGQHGVGLSNGIPPIRYSAIHKGLIKVYDYVCKHESSIHACRFGSGLAGGKWSIIEQMLIDTFSTFNVPVTIYDLKS